MHSPPEVFVSYSKKESEFLDELLTSFRPSIQNGLVKIFSDRDISPGSDWSKTLEDRLENMSLALFLVSRNSIATDYVMNVELKKALQKQQTHGLRILWVPVTSANFEQTPFKDIQAIGNTKKPINAMSEAERDNAWVEIVRVTLDEVEKSSIGSEEHSPQDIKEQIAKLVNEKMYVLEEGGDTTEIDAKIESFARKVKQGRQLSKNEHLRNGRYILRELIGKGGFGTVWRAYDKRGYGREVAIKILHGQLARDQTPVDIFMGGARKMAELNHSAIVTIYERGKEEDGIFYYVMEYLAGGNLRVEVLEKKVNPQDIIPIILEVGKALIYAHEKGVMHNDVKPANILFDENRKVKLTDFDLAHLWDTEGGHRSETNQGWATLLYSPPEIHDAPTKKDPTIDVYGLGMSTLFAFRGKDLPLEVLKGSRKFIHALDNCPWQVKRVLKKALAWYPQDRFQTVAEFCDALKQAQTLKPPQLENTWIDIAPGTFQMGDDNEHAWEKPAHSVTLTQPYQLAAYPVTNAEYQVFVEDNGYNNAAYWCEEGWKNKLLYDWQEPAFQGKSAWSDPMQPVVGVSWFEAMAYCRWLTEVFKRNGLLISGLDENNESITLPTEAQWEFAARGPENRKFPWGDEPPRPNQINHGFQLGQISNIDDFPEGATPSGLHDMAGNHFEWCLDIWNDQIYQERINGCKDPVTTAGDMNRRVRRGSSFKDAANDARASWRNRFHATYRELAGFRCCRC